MVTGETLMRLSNKIAIVTGAGGGIGRVTALRFASEGAKVFAADINEDGIRETADLSDAIEPLVVCVEWLIGLGNGPNGRRRARSAGHHVQQRRNNERWECDRPIGKRMGRDVRRQRKRRVPMRQIWNTGNARFRRWIIHHHRFS